jgi:glycopeptide antibiotics resistance protein
VPFSTIMPYITGIANANSGVALMNILANIFLFIPLGFYVEVLLRKRKMKIKITIIILIPIIVELIQFVFSLGICDVDDVILNAIGGLLGILVLKVVEKLYCIVKKDDTTRLFLI